MLYIAQLRERYDRGGGGAVGGTVDYGGPGAVAIHTSRKRLIDLQRTLHADGKSYRAFDVYNLGRYERQWWRKEYLQGADEEHRRVVLQFFRAEVFEPDRAPSPLIHGRKGPALCHVDGIDSIFTRDEVKEVAKAAASADGKECYCPAWEFEMDLRLTTAALEQELGVKIKLIQIPREIMEKNRKTRKNFSPRFGHCPEPVEGGDTEINPFPPRSARDIEGVDCIELILARG